MKRNEIVAIIPARYGSVRLPGKPLALIGGVPMVQRVYQQVRACELIGRVIVATDDSRIDDCISKIGGDCCLTDSTLDSGSDRVADVAMQRGLDDQTIIINVQGDQPLIHPTSLERLISPFVRGEIGDDEMATLMIKMNKEDVSNPAKVKVVMDENNRALYFSRAPIPFAREGAHDQYYKHLGVYAYRHQFLKRYTALPPSLLEKIEKLEQLRVIEHGYRIKLVETPFDSPEVDEPEDILWIESQSAKGLLNLDS